MTASIVHPSGMIEAAILRYVDRR